MNIIDRKNIIFLTMRLTAQAKEILNQTEIDAKILEIGEGTSEIQRLIISREILKEIQI